MPLLGLSFLSCELGIIVATIIGVRFNAFMPVERALISTVPGVWYIFMTGKYIMAIIYRKTKWLLCLICVPGSLNWWLQLDLPVVVGSRDLHPFTFRKRKLLLHFRVTGLVSHREQSQGEGQAALMQPSAFTHPKGMPWLQRREESQSLLLVLCVVANHLAEVLLGQGLCSVGGMESETPLPEACTLARACWVILNQPASLPLGSGLPLHWQGSWDYGPWCGHTFSESFLLHSDDTFFPP